MSKNKASLATFAFGCFWGKEYLFQNTVGVLSTRVGYTGGHTLDPTYLEVCSKKTGHAEAVEVTFDADKISFVELLKIFFQNHNPTILQRQGENNSGNYRSAIFFHTENQKKEAQVIIQQLHEKGHTIYTQLTPALVFYPAENRHQSYCERTGNIPKEKQFPITF